MNRRGVIDLGTNSVRLLVARIIPSRFGANPCLGEILVDQGRIVRLGQGLRPGGGIDRAAEERTRLALEELTALAAEAGVKRCVILATEALRAARNGADVARRLARAAGSPVRILPAREEAALTLAGSRDLIPRREGALLWDMGGGSTEILRPAPDDPEQPGWESLPLGCVTYAGPAPADGWEDAVGWVRSRLPELSPGPGSTAVVLGGTATALAALVLGLRRFDRNRVHGTELPLEAVGDWGRRLARGEPGAGDLLDKLDPGRLDSMPAGLAILEALRRWSGAAGMRVSVRGIRYGYLLSD